METPTPVVTEYYPPTVPFHPMTAPSSMRSGEYIPMGVTTTQQQQQVQWEKTEKASWTGCLPLVIFLIVVAIWLIVTLFVPGRALVKVFEITIAIVWAIIWAFFIWVAWKAGSHAMAWILALIAIIIWSIILILIFTGHIVINF